MGGASGCRELSEHKSPSSPLGAALGCLQEPLTGDQAPARTSVDPWLRRWTWVE